MKLPPQAKKVFNGVVFDVYQWQQEMFDGTHKTFEMLKRANSIQVIPIKNGKMLLGYEEQPGCPTAYSFFGGRQEENESELDCAKRELLEETGLISDDFELYREWQPVVKIDFKIAIYIARDCKQVQDQKLDAGEKIKIEEFDLDGFLNAVTSNKFWSSEIADHFYRMISDEKTLADFKKKLKI